MAADNIRLVDIVMSRAVNALPSSHKFSKVDLYPTCLLGGGKFGRVFQADAFSDLDYCGAIIMKLPRTGLESFLLAEAAAYLLLDRLYDTAVPHFYGAFMGEYNGYPYSALLLRYSGKPLGTFDNLSLYLRYTI